MPLCLKFTYLSTMYFWEKFILSQANIFSTICCYYIWMMFISKSF